MNNLREVVWITGASSGIGKELAISFSSIGANVILTSRNKKKLLQVEKEIVKYGGNAKSFVCDVRDEKSVFECKKKIQKEFGKIDVLINNSGIGIFKPFLFTSTKEFDDTIATNLRGMFLCIKSVLPDFIERKSGYIFNILSTASVDIFKNSSAYSASKSAAFMMSKVLRREVRKHNIKVINILPGATDTEIWDKESRKKFSHRMMKPHSVADVVLEIFRFPSDVVCEDIILRPQLGNIDD